MSHGDPVFPKLLTATFRGSLKCPVRREGIQFRQRKTVGPNIANDVALTTEYVKDMEHQINTVNEDSLKTGLKIHTGKKQIDDKY